MKRNLFIHFLIAVMLLVFIGGCKKERDSGQVVFFLISPGVTQANLPVIVIVSPQSGSGGNYSGIITTILPFDVPVGVPSPYVCNEPGCATIILPAGTWHYTASGGAGFTDTGTVVVSAGACARVGM